MSVCSHTNSVCCVCIGIVGKQRGPWLLCRIRSLLLKGLAGPKVAAVLALHSWASRMVKIGHSCASAHIRACVCIYMYDYICFQTVT